MSARLRFAAAAALAATLALAAPALADGFGNTGLVRGGAPLPNFTTSFPIELGVPATEPSRRENLEISLTSPDHGVLRFLFSPRTLSGETYGFGPTVTGNYLGLAWNIFDSHHVFGSIGLAGAVNRVMPDDPTRPNGRPLFSLHSTLEFGYELGAQQSLSLALDHATASPYLGDRSAPGDFLRLRYGYHF
ncbi:MAG TPA: hypothetical protein VJR47_06765 [Stellaceae bacterium]|nr:hypothetical protein [Stellaceae bacterium]